MTKTLVQQVLAGETMLATSPGPSESFSRAPGADITSRVLESGVRFSRMDQMAHIVVLDFFAHMLLLVITT